MAEISYMDVKNRLHAHLKHILQLEMYTLYIE